MTLNEEQLEAEFTELNNQGYSVTLMFSAGQAVAVATMLRSAALLGDNPHAKDYADAVETAVRSVIPPRFLQIHAALSRSHEVDE